MAAGRGIRFQPYSNIYPKPLAQVGDESLLIRNIRLLATHFKPKKIYIVIGYLGELIESAVQDYSYGQTKIELLKIPERLVEKGLIGGYAFIEKYLKEDERYLSVLGDEFYGEEDYIGFNTFLSLQPEATIYCTYKKYDYPDDYFKNYAVCLNNLDSNIIERVMEKPSKIVTPWFGLGMVVFYKKLATVAKEEVDSDGQTTFFDLINLFIKQDKKSVFGYQYQGDYFNINSKTDLYHAKRSVRRQNWEKVKIDVIVPAWNEAESIGFVVKDFLKFCRNVIVLDNNSPDGTAQTARNAGAIVYSEPLEGYGDAIKKGLDRSDADLFVIVEADGTFRANDMEKLLPYCIDADAVIGSRTYWQYIEYGANMDFIQRAANVFFGFIITLLWWNRKSRFTDVGCTYRAIWRDSYKKIQKNLIGKGPEFSPEMIIELLNDWQRVIEVPVPYHSRVLGQSKFSGGFFHLAGTAIKMLKMIIYKRIKSWLRNLKAL